MLLMRFVCRWAMLCNVPDEQVPEYLGKVARVLRADLKAKHTAVRAQGLDTALMDALRVSYRCSDSEYAISEPLNSVGDHSSVCAFRR